MMPTASGAGHDFEKDTTLIACAMTALYQGSSSLTSIDQLDQLACCSLRN
jgi:hypothetical protein